MNHKRICRLGGGIIVLGLWTSVAVGQYQYLGSRARAPSTAVGRVGRVGGFRAHPARAPRIPSRWSGGGARSGAVRPHQFGGVGDVPTMGLPAAVRPGRPRVYSPSVQGPYFPRVARTATPYDLKAISHYNASVSFWNPLARAQWNYWPRLTTPPYVPEPQGSAFHEFFGLQPAEPLESEPSGAPMPSLSAAMKEELRQRTQETEKRAREYFKQATDPEVDNRQEKLARAVDLFQSVQHLDEEAYMPAVLMLHAALERGQVMTASNALFLAVQRHPQVFSERPDIASYYGGEDEDDRKARLEQRVREYLRVGEENPDLACAYALQAYCAWVLNDRPRAEQALQQAYEISRGGPDHNRIRAFKAALEAALQ